MHALSNFVSKQNRSTFSTGHFHLVENTLAATADINITAVNAQFGLNFILFAGTFG